MKAVLVLILLVIMFPLPSYGQFFGPDDYDECITDSMKGVTSDVAARAIIQSCSNRFPRERAEPDPSGYFVDENGMGVCSVTWDGSRFVANVGNKRTPGFVGWKISRPGKTAIAIEVPKIMSDQLNGSEEKVRNLVNQQILNIQMSCDYKVL